MDDEQRLKRIIEEVLREHHWADDVVQKALLEVAREYMWRQGLWVRLKYVVNVIGFVGIVGTTVITVKAVMGR